MPSLEEKSIEKITVREICQLAEINRTTFYRNYDNQYALLASLQNALFEVIKSKISEQRPNPDKLYLLMLNLIYEHQDEWLILMGPNADPRITRKITRFIGDYFHMSDKSAEGKMKYRYILSGSAGLLKYWIGSGMRESPKTLAAYLNTYRRALAQAS